MIGAALHRSPEPAAAAGHGLAPGGPPRFTLVWRVLLGIVPSAILLAGASPVAAFLFTIAAALVIEWLDPRRRRW